MNSSTTIEALLGFFSQKKSKLTWCGTLKVLKAFILTKISKELQNVGSGDHQAAESGVSLAKSSKLRGA